MCRFILETVSGMLSFCSLLSVELNEKRTVSRCSKTHSQLITSGIPKLGIPDRDPLSNHLPNLRVPSSRASVYPNRTVWNLSAIVCCMICKVSGQLENCFKACAGLNFSAALCSLSYEWSWSVQCVSKFSQMGEQRPSASVSGLGCHDGLDAARRVSQQ